MASASDQERHIHSRILTGDDLAFAMFCDAFYEPVYQKVKSFHRAINDYDETIIMDVVTDSFLKYFQEPQRYNPEKQSLERFLVMDAEGDLLNAWEKIKVRNKKNKNPVELDDETRNSELEDGELTPLDYLVNKENQIFLEEKLKEVFKEEKDVQLAYLILSGERKSSEYAKILNIEQLTEEEQRREVKRNKDRIDKVIKRKLSEGANE